GRATWARRTACSCWSTTRRGRWSGRTGQTTPPSHCRFTTSSSSTDWTSASCTSTTPPACWCRSPDDQLVVRRGGARAAAVFGQGDGNGQVVLPLGQRQLARRNHHVDVHEREDVLARGDGQRAP